MNSPFSSSCSFSLPFLLFLVFILIPVCLGQDDLYTNCGKQFVCGDITAGYPFWGNDRPEGCGVTELQLRCENDVPKIETNNSLYRVLSINPSTQVLRLVTEDFLDGYCPSKFVNSTLDFTVFDFVPGYTNLTFFYGCPAKSIPTSSSATFTCLINGVSSQGYVQEGAYGPRSCDNSVYVPAPRAAVLASANMSALLKELNAGFAATYLVDVTACTNCKRSNGVCGYDNTSSQPTCYCSGQSSGSTTCPLFPSEALADLANLVTTLDKVFGLLWNANDTATPLTVYAGSATPPTAYSGSTTPSTVYVATPPTAYSGSTTTAPYVVARPTAHSGSTTPSTVYAPSATPPGATDILTLYPRSATPPATTPTAESRSASRGTHHLSLVIGLGVGGAAVIASVALVFWFLIKKRRKKEALTILNEDRAMHRVGDRKIQDFFGNNHSLIPKKYSYSDIKKMTNSFSDKLGQGGFGSVYKGKLRDGRPVAIKVLNNSKGNGEEFINEVASISRTSHVNIVTLLGYCHEGTKRALIYEYMANGSLDKFINRQESSTVDRPLEWKVLFDIAVGIARGLEYLHRGCNTRIVHFDIKPHNILLDENFCPKISDFGLAKLCKTKESKMTTLLFARGTAGYIAPEVFCRTFGGVSYKSDVYSYGMMVLDIVGGRNNSHVGESQSSESFFPDWVFKQLEPDVFSRVYGDVTEEEETKVRKMIIVGLWCIQTNPSDRPTMTKAVEMLEGNLQSLQIPPKPVLSSTTRPPPQDDYSSTSTPTISVATEG